jgi:hypothetical protein
MRSLYLSIVSVSLFLLTNNSLNAQTSVSLLWNFTGDTLGNTVSTPPSGLTVGSFGIGNNNGVLSTPKINATSASTGYTGVSGTNNIGNAAATGAYNANTSAYIQVTLTPGAAYSFSFTGISFGTRATSTGPKNYSIRTSVDNYATNVYSDTIIANSTWTLKNVAFSNAVASSVGSPITIRIYGYNGSGNASTGTINWRIDDITINGNLVTTSNPLITASSASISFGNKCINANYVDSFTVNGLNLTTANVAVAALTGYSYATTLGGTYSNTLSIPQTGGTFSQKIYVQFNPTTVSAYTGSISVSGGGASTGVNITTSGTGISTAPTITTTAATFVTSSSATLNASSITAGCGTVSSYSIEYSTTQNFVSGSGTTITGANLSNGSFSVALSSLTPSTTYYYRATTTNSNGVSTIGTELSFTTLTPAPAITVSSLTAFGSQCINTASTAQSMNITGSNLTNTNVQVGPVAGYKFSTTSNGTFSDSLVITQGGGTLTQTIYVEFLPTATSSYTLNIPVSGGGATSVSVSTTGTGIATLPTLTTSTPITIAYNGATINSSVTAMNCGGITSYGIEYGTDATLTLGTTLASSNNLSSNTYSVVLSGLSANTTYYYRAYSVTGNGTANSTILSFTTLNLPYPNNLQGTNATSSSFIASWNAVSGASDYRLDVSQSSTFTANQATLIGFSFPGSSNLPDTSITANALDSISTVGGTGVPTYAAGTARADTWNNGNGTKAWEIHFSTAGYHNIRVSSKQRSSNTGPKNFKLQYRVGATGTFSDVTGGAVVVDNTYTLGVISQLLLPLSCEDQPIVYLRWTMSSNVSVNNATVASTGASNIDDISVSGGQYSFLAGYQNKLENGLNDTLMGLSANTTYYMRIRSESSLSTSSNSPVVAVTTSCVTPTFSGNVANILCGGSNTGSINLNNSGTGTFGYSWTGPNSFTATTKDISNLEAGIYYVTVTSAACFASDSFVITTPSVLSVNSTISNSSVCSGTTVNLDATASGGTGSYSYLWFGTNNFTATSANTSLVADSLSPGFYSVTVTDSNGCTANSLVMLTNVTPSITPLASITSTATTICAGVSVTFNSTTSGGGVTPSYQWNINGTPISGETNASFTSTTLNDGDVVTLTYTTSEVCYTALTATSNSIAMTVNPIVNPLASISANSSIICPGTNVTFTSLTEGGGSAATYQWYLNGVAMIGETNTTYASSNLNNGDVVSMIMTTSVPCPTSATTTSNSITMNVGAMISPSVTIAASANTICSGNTVSFTSTITNGGNAPTYQWLLNGNAINGATNDSYSTSSVSNNDVFSLSIVSNAACLISTNATSNSQTVTVFIAQGNTVASSPLTLCPGGSVTLTAGNGSNYLWSNGATTQSITINTVGSYSVTYTDMNGCNTSAPAKNIIAKTLPALLKIKTLTTATIVCDPTTVSFAVDPSASSVYGFDFQWTKNGSPIAGATDTVFVASGVGGGNIALTISGSNCNKSSTSKPYTIKQLPIASFSASGPTTFCSGGSVTLNAPVISGYTYTWLKDGVSIGAGNTKVVKLAGNYTAIAKFNNCVDTAMPTMPVIVNALPVAVINSTSPLTFCAGDSALLVAAPTGTGYSYQWINGTISTTNSSSTYEAKIAGTYKVSITDNNGCISKASTTSVKIKVNPLPVATIAASGSLTISATGNVKLNASPTSGVTYQWYKDGVAITGATIKTYTATTSGDYVVAVNKLGCIGFSAPTTVIQTGIKEETGTTSDNSFEIIAYPNPVQDIVNITINTNGVQAEGSIEVMNNLGQIVTQKSISSTSVCTLSTTNWASGVYFIRYKDESGRQGTLKITKQ